MIYKKYEKYDDVWCGPIYAGFSKKRCLAFFELTFIHKVLLIFHIVPCSFLFVFGLALHTKFRNYIFFTMNEINMRRGCFGLEFSFNWRNIKDIFLLAKQIIHSVLLKLSGVTTVATNDPLYYNRVFADTCVFLKMEVYVNANYIVYHYNSADIYSPSEETLSYINTLIDETLVEAYISAKFKGEGRYTDSNRASLIKDRLPVGPTTKHSKITFFLHVFGDSALGKYSDHSRKTANYYQWLERELTAIDPTYLVDLRLHPASKVWGENFIKALAPMYFLGELQNSIYISSNVSSNLTAINTSKYVKTFWGNVAQESVALGVPASTQRKSPMERNFPGAFPCSSKVARSTVSAEQAYIAKKQIYIQECILSCRDITGMDHLYRGSSPEMAESIIRKGREVCETNRVQLELIGSNLAENFSHSVNPSFFYKGY